MSRYTKLNQLVRKSFRHLNKVQTKTAFIRHYFIVEAARTEAELVRGHVRSGAETMEYCPINF